MNRPLLHLLSALFFTQWVSQAQGLSDATLPRSNASTYHLFARTNLMAWCIVPFDGARRGPEQRAAMLDRLGVRMFAYDYRSEHIPQWDDELVALKKKNVSLVAWWFPGTLNQEARDALALFKRHQVRPQLWVMGSGGPANPDGEKSHVAAEARRIQSIATAGAEVGCIVGLYNHGGWFGQPENQIKIIEALRSSGITNVGIVYNLHHGHEHMDRFAVLLDKMKPYLIALNLNGMFRSGDQRGLKIVPIGQGELDRQWLQTINGSGWRGPIGILNHTDEDAEGRLRDNLAGLDWLVAGIRGKEASTPRPAPKTWRAPANVSAP